MVPDRHPAKFQFSVLFTGRNESQVGGPPANIDDEQRISHFQFLAPAISHPVEPGIYGSLWFFEQHEVLRETGRDRRLPGEFAGAGIKRRRNGQHNALPAERGLGKVMFPSCNKMFEDSL